MVQSGVGDPPLLKGCLPLLTAEAGVSHAVVFGQVGMRPHGSGEFHRGTSVRPYWQVLDRWADSWPTD